MRRLVIALPLALSFLGIPGGAAPVFSQQASPGPFTDAQAEAGAATYAAECRRCHGSKLQGGVEEPPLSGPRFLSRWGEQTTADLLNFVETRMPPQQPGGLGLARNLELVAFILKSNGALSGPNLLTREAAAKISGLMGAQPPPPTSPAAGNTLNR